MDNLLTVSQVAGELQITTRHVRHLLVTKKLTGEKVGDRWFVDREVFERFKANYRKYQR